MKKNNIDKWLSKQLADIKKANLHRTLVEISSSMGPEIKIGNKTFYQFASNNYLGLTHHPEVIQAGIQALEKWGSGCTGSRFLNGNLSFKPLMDTGAF